MFQGHGLLSLLFRWVIQNLCWNNENYVIGGTYLRDEWELNEQVREHDGFQYEIIKDKSILKWEIMKSVHRLDSHISNTLYVRTHFRFIPMCLYIYIYMYFLFFELFRKWCQIFSTVNIFAWMCCCMRRTTLKYQPLVGVYCIYGNYENNKEKEEDRGKRITMLISLYTLKIHIHE